jgi:NitT/TauT family transport system substrate-binding protein
MKSPGRVTVAFVTILILLAAGCSKSSTPAPTTGALTSVILQANWYAEAEYAGYYQALAKGYYKEAGLDVRIIQGGPGAYPVQKVATSQVQFGLARSDDLMLAAEQKLPVVMLSAQLEHDPQVIMVHAESAVHDFPDLDGKSIMAEPGSAWISFLQRKYKIRINTIPENYEIAQFMADKNYIQQGFLTNEPFIFQQRNVATRSLLIANSGYDPYRVLFSNRTYVREHPEIVRAFVQASIQGWRDYLEGDPAPGDALITRDYAGSTPAVLAFARTQLKESRIAAGDPAKGEQIGLITRRRLAEQIAILQDLGLLTGPLTVDQVATFEFLPAELQAMAK